MNSSCIIRNSFVYNLLFVPFSHLWQIWIIEQTFKAFSDIYYSSESTSSITIIYFVQRVDLTMFDFSRVFETAKLSVFSARSLHNVCIM